MSLVAATLVTGSHPEPAGALAWGRCRVCGRYVWGLLVGGACRDCRRAS